MKIIGKFGQIVQGCLCESSMPKSKCVFHFDVLYYACVLSANNGLLIKEMFLNNIVVKVTSA